MGVVVGSKTELECDGVDCNEKSQSDHEQCVALNNAYSSGWVKKSSNGKTYCPKCVRLKVGKVF